MTKPLSPTAAAVWEAFERADCDPYLVYPRKAGLAAALRATADYALCSAYAGSPSTDWGEGWEAGIRDTAQGLRSMADELDHYRQLLMDDRRETHALATEARPHLDHRPTTATTP